MRDIGHFERNNFQLVYNIELEHIKCVVGYINLILLEWCLPFISTLRMVQCSCNYFVK